MRQNFFALIGLMLLLFSLNACTSKSSCNIVGKINTKNGASTKDVVFEGCKLKSLNQGVFKAHCDTSSKDLVVLKAMQAGYAPGWLLIKPTGIDTYTASINIGQKIITNEYKVVDENTEITPSTRNLSVRGSVKNFVHNDGTPLDPDENVKMSIAYWDAIRVDRDNAPFVGEFLDAQLNRLPIIPVAYAYINGSGDTKPLRIKKDAPIEAIMFGSSIGTSNVNNWSDQNLLFYFDETKGVWISRKFIAVDDNNFSMKFTVDHLGLWMWAKPYRKTVCVDVAVSFPNGKNPEGLQLDMIGDFFHKTIIGADQSVACMQADAGYVVSIIGTLFSHDHFLTVKRSTFTLPNKPSTCDQSCPAHLDLEFNCQDDHDCSKGHCVNNECQ